MEAPSGNTRNAVDDRIRQVGLVQAGTELKVAAILFTYRCTISCRHCLFACRGARPDVVMDADRCVRYLAQLHELGRVVHIAGGEANPREQRDLPVGAAVLSGERPWARTEPPTWSMATILRQGEVRRAAVVRNEARLRPDASGLRRAFCIARPPGRAMQNGASVTVIEKLSVVRPAVPA